MNNTVPFKHSQNETQPMTRVKMPLSFKVIPEWMFKIRPNGRLLASTDPVEVTWECPICGTVTPYKRQNGYTFRECECAYLARQSGTSVSTLLAENQQALARIRAGRAYTWLGKGFVFAGMESKTFETFHADWQPQAYREVKDYADLLAGRGHAEEMPNITMLSTPGVGKTHLATALINCAKVHGIPCLYATTQRLFDALYESGFTEKKNILSQAHGTQVLVLDELDKLYIKQKDDHPEREGEYQKHTLFELLNERYNRGLPTVIIANEVVSLKRWLDDATISRIRENVLPVRFASTTKSDYRARAKGDR